MGTTLTGPMALQVRSSTQRRGSLVRSQVVAQQVCDVLNIEIQPITIDVLGLQVTTLPVGINVTADGTGTNVLGHLVCTILATVGNVIGLVDLLNALLGLLTGLV